MHWASSLQTILYGLLICNGASCLWVRTKWDSTAAQVAKAGKEGWETVDDVLRTAILNRTFPGKNFGCTRCCRPIIFGEWNSYTMLVPSSTCMKCIWRPAEI